MRSRNHSEIDEQQLYELSRALSQLKNAEETPETIIKLSDILRYVIYGSNRVKVPLKSEVELINNYISLQNYRIDDASKIVVRSDIDDKIEVAPMLFLPLVENSFKHGIKGDPSGGYVNIKIDIRERGLELSLENNKGKVDEIEDLENSGIGLANVRRRLELIYPGKNRLDINDTGTDFSVKLTLELT